MRLRIAPDGGFVEALPPTAQPPLEVGPGTEGTTYRADGVNNTVLLGAGNQAVLEWAHPTTGVPVNDLPWILTPNVYYEIVFATQLLEAVATPGGNLVATVSARRISTGVRENLTSWSYIVQPASPVWNVRMYRRRNIISQFGSDSFDNVQVDLDGAVTLTTVAAQTHLSITQFVP